MDRVHAVISLPLVVKEWRRVKERVKGIVEIISLRERNLRAARDTSIKVDDPILPTNA